jgi:uncharacterized lipoprotein YajG
MKQLPILAACLMLTGCIARVPATSIRVGTVEIISPKEIEARGVRVIKKGSDVDVRFDSLSSHNSPDVLATVAAANAKMADKVLQALDKLEAIAAKGAASAVVP